MHNQIVRCELILTLIVAGSIFLNLAFDLMYDVVHMDEKWFYRTEENLTVYFAHNGPDPEKHCKSKRYIGNLYSSVQLHVLGFC